MPEFYLYPGVLMNVSAPTKVVMTPLAPGEVPPPGATIIPPQVGAMAGTIRAVQANLEVARQGLAAAETLTNQQTKEAQAAFDAQVQKTNQEAARVAQEQPPPWEVTFTEKR